MEVKLKFPPLQIDEKKYKKHKVNIRDTQIKKLPKKIVYCKTCVIPNQRPRTDFDSEGVCSACRYAEKKFHGGIDWNARENELMKLLDRHRSKDGSYDCIVPSSGGKDSSI